MTLYTANGKQVLRDGVHFADCCDPGAATLVADALSTRALRQEAWDNAKRILGIDIGQTTQLRTTEIGAYRICQAYQASDQMICPCGKQWDVNDPEPPECGDAPS